MSSSYKDMVERTGRMVYDDEAVALVRARGLDLLPMTWEDAARYKHSSVGPNISDMTIQVDCAPGPGQSAQGVCMPVIRAPNFHDRSGDIPPERFQLLVGNESGDALRSVNLRELLADLPSFLHDPDGWTAPQRSLLAATRDSHVLVSAQACLLPVPPQGVAAFTPVLFNYQSRAGDPAVLTLLASREGTSITVIDPAREPDEERWGQRLYFNDDGRRCVFTGQRLSSFEEAAKAAEAGGATQHAGAEDPALLGRLLLIQIPLKTRRPAEADGADAIVQEPVHKVLSGRRDDSDVESAVLGHGAGLGPFIETGGIPIERDERYPIRVTVQFYQATSNGVLDAADVQRIAVQLERVYEDAENVGSLVAGSTNRPTEYDGEKVEPPDWWERFWHESASELAWTQRGALAQLRARFGADLALATPESAGTALRAAAAA